MQFRELTEYLAKQFSLPQPSERWAMYRLINPVMDYANQALGLIPYFEYNQTSSHGTHQSVDIALLDRDEHPIVFIEAKRADRKVSPEQIEKYLDSTDRGIVTNGYIWVLCFDGQHEAVTLYHRTLDDDALSKVIGFIQGSFTIAGKTNTTDDVYINPVKPRKIVNKVKISRPSHAVTVSSSQNEFVSFIADKQARPENELALLNAISDTLGTAEMPVALRIETRKTRVSFFDERLPRNDKRLARIELGKAQPDLLVRTWIVETHPELTDIAPTTIHDKGAHMRRFRLSNEEQSADFGKTLLSVLATVVQHSD